MTDVEDRPALGAHMDAQARALAVTNDLRARLRRLEDQLRDVDLAGVLRGLDQRQRSTDRRVDQLTDQVAELTAAVAALANATPTDSTPPPLPDDSGWWSDTEDTDR